MRGSHFKLLGQQRVGLLVGAVADWRRGDAYPQGAPVPAEHRAASGAGLHVHGKHEAFSFDRVEVVDDVAHEAPLLSIRRERPHDTLPRDAV